MSSSDDEHPKPTFHRPTPGSQHYDHSASGLGTPPTWLAPRRGSATGPAGPAGPTGATGAPGAAGATGATGATGPGLPAGSKLEYGRIGSITVPNSGGSPNYVDVAITFSPAFASVPALVLSYDTTSASNNDPSMYVPMIESLTTAGATVRIRHINNTNFSGMILNWIAVGT